MEKESIVLDNKEEIKEDSYFVITEDGKKVIYTILENKPFKTVVNVITLLEKDVLSLEEGNAIINFIAEYSYKEVLPFFSNIKNYIKNFNGVEEKIDGNS
jgi:hypothetical protein